jgi:signal transduction histidine kinase
LCHAHENDSLPHRFSKTPCLDALQQTAEELRSDEVVYRYRLAPDRAYEYVGPSAEAILGRPPEAFYANPDIALELVAEEDRPLIEALFTDPAERAGPLLVRWRHDETVIWTEVLRVPIRDEAGRVVAVEGVLRDVTRQKAIESERDRHAAMLQALIANLQDGVMAENEDGRITVANDAFSRMFDLPDPAVLVGIPAQDVREAAWATLVDDAEKYRELTARLRRERKPQLGFELSLTDGRVLDRDYVPVVDREGAVTHMWHYRDVTKRKELEEGLRESKRRLREFAAYAEQTREEERRQMARTLHDELGQLFSSIRLELAAAIAQFRESAAPEMRPVVDRLQAAAGLTDIGVGSLRQLTTSLRPPILDHLGLVPAIRWEASLFAKRTGIRCHVRARPGSLALDDVRVTALYRILGAALDNIAKHAGAGTVWIHLGRRGGVTLMEIRDNGRGITDAQVNNARTMGLLGMRERALALGGEVQITRGRRSGTRVLVTLPDGDSAP